MEVEEMFKVSENKWRSHKTSNRRRQIQAEPSQASRNTQRQWKKQTSIGHTNSNRQDNPTGDSASIKPDIRATVSRPMSTG